MATGPPEPGSYVAYVGRGCYTRALLFYCDGEWGYPLSDQKFRDTASIVACYGPLPCPAEVERQLKGSST